MEAALQALLAAAASFLLITSLFLLVLLCRSPPKPHPLQTLNLTRPIRNPNANFIVPFDPSLDHISLADLAAATGNFSTERIVGDGGFGFVYRAVLPSGAAVAVKKLSADAAFHGLREFRAEIETLARIRHPNLCRILGCCASGPDRILIYEFLHNGSLDAWIHEPVASPLPWKTRIRIVTGVAAGLAFLHNECKPPIIHRDIKASNVLLDAEFGSRIADFGLARRFEDSAKSHVSTQVAGTMGYMPPEYREGSTVATAKADVYSFGILMYEVAAGRRPSWPVMGEDGREVALVRWARGLAESGRGSEVLDPLIGDAEEGEVAGYLGVAYWCTEESPRKRPTMGEVVELLGSLSS
ncbi:putative leucine-rich repeat receptor protein kinase MSP1-like [Iris pallida]|uniref:Leucine-rich repeat receptor protein kinase MSP1-like n=1 Tax=Iris pallida TaxID=29817 RepID=A0AAX6H1N0_IRIPA|nr:putative leucine-rich repeat receptor protein kinase MSP1-like [Iris pallida]